MNDLPDLVESWRKYRRMLDIDWLPRAHYERLVSDFALIIKRRLGL